MEIKKEMGSIRNICYLKQSYLENLTTWQNMSAESLRPENLGKCINCTDYRSDSIKECYRSDAINISITK